MPVYEYKCTMCNERFDIEQSFTDDALTTLEGCGVDPSGDHRLKKVFHAVGIAFKGEGFYRNDSRSSVKAGSAGNGSDSDSSTTSSSDSASSTSSTSSSGDTSTGSTPSPSKTESTSGTKDSSGTTS